MSIPSFKETLQVTLGPDITIVEGGDYFDMGEKVEGLDMSTMNRQLESISKKGDEIVFMPAENQKDIAFEKFLEEAEGQK